MKPRKSDLVRKLLWGGAIFLLFLGLKLSAPLWYRITVETWAAGVGVAIFAFSWNAQKRDSVILLLLGTGYILTAVFGLLHLFAGIRAQAGMPLMPFSERWLWTLARGLETVVFLLVPAFFLYSSSFRTERRRICGLLVGSVFFLALCMAIVFHNRQSPLMIVHHPGLARGFVVFLLFFAFGNLYMKREKLVEENFGLLIPAAGLSLASEGLLIAGQNLWPAVYSGYLLYVLSFYLIYWMVVHKGLEEPCRDLEERLKEVRSNLRAVNDCLLSLGPDTERNISEFVRVVGELLEADMAFYNERRNHRLQIRASWNAPEEIQGEFAVEGHLCEHVISSGGRHPLVLTDLKHSRFATSDPGVKAFGLETYIGCPVEVRGKTVGSLCAVFTEPVQPSEERLEVLSSLARGLGIEIERSRAEAEIHQSVRRAMELQETLFPQKLPVLPALDLAAEHCHAENASGDYYDLHLTDMQLVFLMADVTGHGMDAALITVFVSSFFRRELEGKEEVDPSTLLFRLHDEFRAQKFPPEYSLEVFVGSYDREESIFSYAAAGAIRAWLVDELGAIRRLPESRGMVINGYIDEPHFGSGKIPLKVGEGLLVHTDGLDEPFVRSEDISGPKQVHTFTSRVFGLLPIQEALRGLVDDTLFALNEETPPDDMALFGIRRRPSVLAEWDFRVKREVTNVSSEVERIMGVFEGLDVDSDGVRMSLFEALANAIEHSDGEGVIAVSGFRTRNTITLVVDDRGSGFDWRKATSRSVDFLSAVERGRGLELISCLTDRFAFNTTGSTLYLQWFLEGVE